MPSINTNSNKSSGQFFPSQMRSGDGGRSGLCGPAGSFEVFVGRFQVEERPFGRFFCFRELLPVLSASGHEIPASGHEFPASGHVSPASGQDLAR